MGVMYQHFNLLRFRCTFFQKSPISEDRTNPVARFEIAARLAIRVARLDLRLGKTRPGMPWNRLMVY